MDFERVVLFDTTFCKQLVNLFTQAEHAPLKADPTCDCPRRRELAKDLLETCLACLTKQSSDITHKLKALYHAEFETMRATGQCPEQLRVVFLALRSIWLGETQEVEGRHSTKHFCYVFCLPWFVSWKETNQ